MQIEPASRIAPILPSEWDETILDALGAFPRSLNFVMSRWRDGGVDARGMHALGAIARHAPLAKAYMTLNAHVAGASTLEVRVREIAILRISWLRHSEYEFVQHLILGRRAGLTDADFERIQLGPDAPGWDPGDAEVVRAVDELCAGARIGDTTWARLAQRYTVPQLIDLVFLIGCYEILAMAVNSFNIGLEPGVQPLDPETRARLLASTSTADRAG
jgi:4-carboxymuconolactone decarboxylase